MHSFNPLKSKQNHANYISKPTSKPKQASQNKSNNTWIQEKETKNYWNTFRKCISKEQPNAKYKTSKNSPERNFQYLEQSKANRDFSNEQKEKSQNKNTQIKTIFSTSKIKELIKESMCFDNWFIQKIKTKHNSKDKSHKSKQCINNTHSSHFETSLQNNLYNNNINININNNKIIYNNYGISEAATKVKRSTSNEEDLSQNSSKEIKSDQRLYSKEISSRVDVSDYTKYGWNNKDLSLINDKNIKNNFVQAIYSNKEKHQKNAAKAGSYYCNPHWHKNKNHVDSKSNSKTKKPWNDNSSTSINNTKHTAGYEKCNQHLFMKYNNYWVGAENKGATGNNFYAIKKNSFGNCDISKYENSYINNNGNIKSNSIPNWKFEIKKISKTAYPTTNNSRKSSAERSKTGSKNNPNKSYSSKYTNSHNALIKSKEITNFIISSSKNKNNSLATSTNKASATAWFKQKYKPSTSSNNSGNNNNNSNSNNNNNWNLNSNNSNGSSNCNLFPGHSHHGKGSSEHWNQNNLISASTSNITKNSYKNMNNISKYMEVISSTNFRPTTAKKTGANNNSIKHPNKDYLSTKIAFKYKNNAKSLTTVQSKHNSKSSSLVEEYWNIENSNNNHNKINIKNFQANVNKNERILKKITANTNHNMPSSAWLSHDIQGYKTIKSENKSNISGSCSNQNMLKSSMEFVKKIGLNWIKNDERNEISSETRWNLDDLQTLKTENVTIERLMNETNNSLQSTIRESMFYRKEMEKIANFIRHYYNNYSSYPETKMHFYKYGRWLGRGAFGKVNLALHISSGRLVAIKSFNKEKIKIKDKDAKKKTGDAYSKIKSEIEVWKKWRHEYVSWIWDTFETEQHILIVMEYICGDWQQFIRKRSKLTENVAKIIFKQIIEGWRFIHSNKIVHRDIKPDNIWIDLSNTVKICDFGVSRKIKNGVVMHEHCGTPAYIAPEIFKNNGYEGYSCDIWSAGITWYYMLSGNQPFKGKDLADLQKIILEEKYDKIEGISNEAQHLIGGMWQSDPKKRLTISQILVHPWLINVNLQNRGQIKLFSKAERILLSKFNVDYLTSPKEEWIENFTDQNLDTKAEEEKQGGNTKSYILAPYNSFNDSYSLRWCNIKIENHICKFVGKINQANIKYEWNNNAEFDNGVIITQNNFSHENPDPNADNNSTSNNVSISKPISPNVEINEDVPEKKSGMNSPKGSSSSLFLEGCHKLVINDLLISHIENNTGYASKYIYKALKKNEVNYATATYYLMQKARNNENECED